MKKFLSIILILALLLGLSAPAMAAQVTTKQADLYYREVKILIDGKQLIPQDVNGDSTEPFIIDGTTYLPIRAVASALGLKVDWDEKTSTISLTSGGQVNYGSGEAVCSKKIVHATVGYRGITIRLNGVKLVLADANGKTVEPFIMGGTTYVPVRAVADALGLQVGWNEAMNTVILSSGKCWLPKTVERSRTNTLTGVKTKTLYEYSYNTDGSPASIKVTSSDRSYTLALQYDSEGRITKLSITGAGLNQGYEHKYDKAGRLVYEKDWNGRDYQLWEYVYSESGNLSSKTLTKSLNGSSSKVQYIYVYNKKGQLSTEILKSGGDDIVTSYTYDSKGRLSTVQYPDAWHTMKEVYSYDSRDNLIGIRYYDCGEQYGSRSYVYDDTNRLSSESYVLRSFSSSTTYLYDESGRMLETRYKDSDGNESAELRGYDRYGNVCFSRSEESANGSSSFEELHFEYNAAGDLLYRSRIDSNGGDAEFSAEYDAIGRELYSENRVGKNTGLYTAEYEFGLWPVKASSSSPFGFTSDSVEYLCFDSDRWLPLLEQLHEMLADIVLP